MTLALIDFDTVAYRCAASCEPTKEKLEREPLDIAIQRADELVYRILNTTQTSEYRGFLGGSENFRSIIYPDYKANRVRSQRPAWLDTVREFLVTEWKAEIVGGMEADDGIGIALNEDSIICGNDKDFRQLAGNHYNFVKDEFFVVTPAEASLAFWTQVLVGDSSDNVRGAAGIGPVKARRILSGVAPEDMEAVVRDYFTSREDFLLTCRLLKILRSKEEYEDIETSIREGQGQKFTEDSSEGDLSPFSTVNS